MTSTPTDKADDLKRAWEIIDEAGDDKDQLAQDIALAFGALRHGASIGSDKADEVVASGIWPDFIAPPKYENPAPEWTDPALPDFRLIWNVARECGYSVGLHGSMKRDCDLIAVPWTEAPEPPQTLIDSLCKALNAREVGDREPKPFGRLAVNLQIDGWFKLIDLSIMLPMWQPDVGTWITAADGTSYGLTIEQGRRAIAAALGSYRFPADVERLTAAEAQLATIKARLAEVEGDLTLAQLREANVKRQAIWCSDEVPDLSFRGNELAGETGEANNVIKKLERERLGWRGSRDTVEHLAEELADVVICADLCAITAGIDLSAAVVAKFNATSVKVGIDVTLPSETREGGDRG